MYVSDNDFEAQIKEFLESEKNKIKFCVGYTGIGKTTSIRHCFDLGVSNEVYMNEKEKELVFPTFLDPYQKGDMGGFDLSSRVASVCSFLEKKYNELRDLMKTEQGKLELHHFIEAYSPEILEHGNPVKEMNMDTHEWVRSRLNYAYEYDPLIFHINRLKFYIKKKYDEIQRFVIILDDIETLPENCQGDTIQQYLQLYHCICKTDYTGNDHYSVKLLISVRPHTYRLLSQEQKQKYAVAPQNAITKKKLIDLNVFFKKRFDYYTKIVQRTIGNKSTWDECYDALMDMSRTFDGQYKEMIQSLCFWNIRESLASYSRIFANRFWVQKNMSKESSFKVSVLDYSFNNINVIRALACNEEQVFWGDDNCIIPNIFYTTEQEDYSIYCLLTLRYFWNRKGYDDYGINAEKLMKIKGNWEEIFGMDVAKKFVTALTFLFQKKVLRKSIIDFDDVKTIDKSESLNDDSLLYISPRGNELYHMFSRDSVLLEMLRESAWRDYENRPYYSTKSSYELMQDSRQIDIFKDLLEYIHYFCDMEQIIMSSVKVRGKWKEYKTSFTSKPITFNLLKGVKNSLDYSGIIYREDINSLYQQMESQIMEMEKRYYRDE